MRFLFWTLIAVFLIVFAMRVTGKGGRVLKEADSVVQTLAKVLRYVVIGVLAYLGIKYAVYLLAPYFH